MSIKEKFEAVKAKAKEKFEVVKEKASNVADNILSFIADHPTLSTVIVIGACVAGSAVSSAVKASKEPSIAIDSGESEETMTYPEDDEEFRRLWETEYKDTYDKVTAFAETLDLKRGETYIIEDQKQYILNGTAGPKMDPSKPIVSHLVDNCGLYPPEEVCDT